MRSREAPLPHDVCGRILHFGGAYIDGTDEAEVVPAAEDTQLRWGASAWDVAVGQAFQRWNMLSEPSKEVRRSYDARSLGGWAPGKAGRAAPHPEKVAALIGRAWHLLGRERPSYTLLAHGAGRWCFNFLAHMC